GCGKQGCKASLTSSSRTLGQTIDSAGISMAITSQYATAHPASENVVDVSGRQCCQAQIVAAKSKRIAADAATIRKPTGSPTQRCKPIGMRAMQAASNIQATRVHPG